MDTVLLSTAYLGPLQYYSKLKRYDSCIIEQHEHFVKQTYRSRCDVYSPNGVLTLSIPLLKRNARQAVKDVRIAYEYDWQKLHWRSLESCYRRSPFFEYYEDDFRPFFEDKKPEFLIDFNVEIQSMVLGLLKMKPDISYTTEYHKEYPAVDDLRDIISPKVSLENSEPYFQTAYMQVFEPRHGFIPNLSIVDLLFNQGSKSAEFI